MQQRQFSSLAVGHGPVVDVDGNAVQASGMVPSFYDPSLLPQTDFKVLIGSWQRLNMASTSTNDFISNVAAYAPKNVAVITASLTDVDIPNTQLLVEKEWSRMFFDLGFHPSVDCRLLRLRYTCPEPCAADVLLPLPLDKVVSISVVDPNTVVISLQHRVPAPIQTAFALWPNLRLLGFPDGPVALSPQQVAPGNSAFSFVVYSTALATKVTNQVPGTVYYLASDGLNGPTELAAYCSAALQYALNSSSSSSWQVHFKYLLETDQFAVQVRAQHPTKLALEGAISGYMGFGEGAILERCQGIGQRVGCKSSYAQVTTGDTRQEVELAAWVENGFQAFVWPEISLEITLPGLPAINIAYDAGCMDLERVAEQMQLFLSANAQLLAAGIQVAFVSTPYRGLSFTSPTTAFGLKFDSASISERLGYLRQTDGYPPSTVHLPNIDAVHVPLLSSLCGGGCAEGDSTMTTIPPCRVRASYAQSTSQLQFLSEPLPVFKATCISTAFTDVFTVTNVLNYYDGLRVGAKVHIAGLIGMTYIQIPAVVVDRLGPSSFQVVVENFLDAANIPSFASPVTIVPVDVYPITLYMQRGTPFHEFAVDPDQFGFAPITYEALGPYTALLSPGTLEITQDNYVLVCLGFSAGDDANTGQLFYPLYQAPGASRLVFAKVSRNVFLRSTFDSKFEFSFSTGGMHLTYVHVQLLNPNGTLYQTHGHPVSVTLKMHARSDGVASGGAHTVLPGSNTGAVEINPISRGSYFY